jgi:hypothetical protein
MEARLPQFSQDPGIPLPWAIDLAENAHHGQPDKGDGGPYIRHPLRVMAALEPYGLDAQITGILHDVVEDSPDNPGPTYTIEDLRDEQGVAEHILAAVDALTKRPGEEYEDLIARAKQNPLATLVKIADNRDHSNPARLALLSDEDRQKAERKYPAALEQLIDGDEWLAEQAELIEKHIWAIYAAEQEQFNQEGPLHLNFSIDPEYAIRKLSQMNQSQVIHNLYKATKGYDMTQDGTSPAAHSVDGLVGEIYIDHDPAWNDTNKDSEVWDDAALDRILRDGRPETLEEEEFMRVCKLRASMTIFSYTALALSVLPDDVKAKFATTSKGTGIYSDSSHLSEEEVWNAQVALHKWEFANAEEDIPLDFGESGEAQIRRICDRVNELIDFYNEHSDELLDPSKRIPGKNINLAPDRGSLVRSMLSLLGTEKEAADMRQIRSTILR